MSNGIEKKDIQDYLTAIPEIAVQVISRPADFYRGMPRQGGFTDPLIFLVVMGFAGGVIQALLSILGLGLGSFGLVSIILSPILAAIFGFIGAGIAFVIWRLMGSTQSYETAYRCAAYAAAISPITTLLQPIPYLGALIGIAWGFYLMVIASVEVHRIEPRKSWIVFGVLALIFSLASISSERTARNFAARVADFKAEEMTPEEAGRKMGEFLKGLQKGAKD